MGHQEYNKYGFWPADGRNAKITYLPVASSQTLAVGDPVYLSSGLVTVAATTATTLCGIMAQPAASLATSTLVAVYADPDQLFECTMDGVSSSVTAGTLVDIAGATGAFILDSSNSTYDTFLAIRSNPQDSTAAALARWIVKIYNHDLADISS